MPGMRMGPASAYSSSLKGVRTVCTRPPGNARASSTTTRWPGVSKHARGAEPRQARADDNDGYDRLGDSLAAERRPSDHRCAEGRQPEELSATDRAGRGDGFVRASHFVGLKSISVEGGAVGITGRTYGFSEATWQLWHASSVDL